MLQLLGAASPIIGALFKTVDKAIDRKEEREQIKSNIQQQVMAGEMKELSTAANIILAEAKSESWLARNWRPLLMLIVVLIIANNYLLVPYANAFFGWGILLELPDTLWTLLTIGVGGYTVGRSAEKVAGKLKKEQLWDTELKENQSQKNNMSLVANINRRRRLGISRSKKNSTISPKAYKAMQNNWKDKKK